MIYYITLLFFKISQNTSKYKVLRSYINLWKSIVRNISNQRDIFQHVPIIFQKPVKPDSMGVPGFSPFGDVHMSFRIPPRLDARE